jgi:hypothetical protein
MELVAIDTEKTENCASKRIVIRSFPTQIAIKTQATGEGE